MTYLCQHSWRMSTVFQSWKKFNSLSAATAKTANMAVITAMATTTATGAMEKAAAAAMKTAMTAAAATAAAMAKPSPQAPSQAHQDPNYQCSFQVYHSIPLHTSSHIIAFQLYIHHTLHHNISNIHNKHSIIGSPPGLHCEFEPLFCEFQHDLLLAERVAAHRYIS